MSQEIQIGVTANIQKGGASANASYQSVLDMSGTNINKNTQDIATSATALTFGAVSGAPKKLIIANLDGTNYVEVDSANTFDKFPQKIYPKTAAGQIDFIVLNPETGTIYAKANTATVKIEKIAMDA